MTKRLIRETIWQSAEDPCTMKTLSMGGCERIEGVKRAMAEELEKGQWQRN